MAHLRLVHAQDAGPPTEAGEPQWVEQTLDIPSLVEYSIPVDNEPDEWELEEPDPQFMTLLEAVDDLFVGRTPEEKLAIGKGFYFDATGAPRTRHNQLRAV